MDPRLLPVIIHSEKVLSGLAEPQPTPVLTDGSLSMTFSAQF